MENFLNGSIYEESNLSRAFPTKWTHGYMKVLDWRWFNSRSLVGAVLAFDLSQRRLIGFMGSPNNPYDSEENHVKEIVNYGCTLPTDIVIVMFKTYFKREEVTNLLDKEFKLFLNLTDILDEK